MIQISKEDLLLCLYAVQKGDVQAAAIAEKIGQQRDTQLSQLLSSDGLLTAERLSELQQLAADTIDTAEGSADVATRESSSATGSADSNLPASDLLSSAAFSTGDHPSDFNAETWATNSSLSSQQAAPTPVPSERYVVLSNHASGGLGDVFRARDQELDREVALKQIRSGFHDEPSTRNRFTFEAKLTGQLEHPGIVPIYGFTKGPEGQPRYAMRFIEGRTFSEAIKDYHQSRESNQQLAFRKLLQQLVTVCYTVNYAHTRGVLHRDLKPQNIMLGSHDETLVVDWGIAKLMRDDQRRRGTDTASSAEEADELNVAVDTGTRQGAAIGTPGYMSPEQAMGWNDTLNARSDVYSLGAILYTLLSGRSPLADCESLEELRSRVVAGDFPQLRSVRKDLPKALIRITETAMATIPKDRYASAEAIAHDLEAYLADEPVSVVPESIWARSARFFRKHRSFVVTAFVAITAISIISIVTAVLVNEQRAIADTQKTRALQLVEEKDQLINEKERLIVAETKARQEAETSNRNNRDIVAFLTNAFRSPDPLKRNARKITVAEILDRAAAALENSLDDQPERRSLLHYALGSAYEGMGIRDAALEQTEKYRQYTVQAHGETHPESLKALHNLAVVYREIDPNKAFKLISKVIKLEPTRQAKSVATLGTVLASMGRYQQAITALNEALKLYDQEGESGKEKYSCYLALGNSWTQSDELEKGLEYLRQAEAAGVAHFGVDHPRTLHARTGLARTLMRLKKWQQAKTILAENVASSVRQLGEEHPFTVQALANLATASGRTGEPLRERDINRKLVNITRKTRDVTSFIYLANNLASFYVRYGEYGEALKLYREIAPLAKRYLSVEHTVSAAVTYGEMSAAISVGEHANAVKVGEDYLRRNSSPQTGVQMIRHVRVKLLMIQALLGENQVDVAAKRLAEISTPPNPNQEGLLYNSYLAMKGLLAAKQGNRRQAAPLLERSHAKLIKVVPDDGVVVESIRHSYRRMIEFYQQQKQSGKVESLRQSLQQFNKGFKLPKSAE